MVCVAMLLRIRWDRKMPSRDFLTFTNFHHKVIDANYSFALMLLLKYPPPDAQHGPQTFVDDAIYLRDNFSAAGGAKIISKYSGKAPSVDSSDSRPGTPLGQALSPKRQFGRTRSPLPSPARFLQQQGGIEALFQGATKGVFDRGERLGINQAVRDAVGEVKKNMQGLQASRANSANRRTSDVMRWSLDEGKQVPASRASVSAINARNKQLAHMLGQAMTDLRAVSLAPDGDKETYVKAMDLAIAKVEFVKVYLEDATIPLPEVSSPATESANTTPLPPRQGTLHSTSKPTPDLPTPDSGVHTPITELTTKPLQVTPTPDNVSSAKELSTEENVIPAVNVPAPSTPAEIDTPARPKAPVPTRSTIAQSSFSWMLEPDSTSSPVLNSSPPKSSSPFLKSSRKPTSGPKREKAAFLFGEEGGEPSARIASLVDVEEAFNLRTMKDSKPR
jgi:TBC1 domain family protein 5